MVEGSRWGTKGMITDGRACLEEEVVYASELAAEEQVFQGTGVF